MARELRTAVYPSRLSDCDLTHLQSLVFRAMNQCPQFSYWLVEALQDEQVRRLERKPPQRFGVPVNWSGSMLAQAITVATALTQAPPSEAAGRFAKSLLATITALAKNKLEYVR